jgi:hypothetical protein
MLQRNVAKTTVEVCYSRSTLNSSVNEIIKGRIRSVCVCVWGNFKLVRCKVRKIKILMVGCKGYNFFCGPKFMFGYYNFFATPEGQTNQ